MLEHLHDVEEIWKQRWASASNDEQRDQESFQTYIDVDLSEESSPFFVILRELIPKSEHFPNILELLIYGIL